MPEDYASAIKEGGVEGFRERLGADAFNLFLSVCAGVGNIGEIGVDCIAMLYYTSKYNSPSDEERAAILDFVRTEWVNDQFKLCYDSRGSRYFQSDGAGSGFVSGVTTGVGVAWIVAATGGGAAPMVAGAVVGSGQSAQAYLADNPGNDYQTGLNAIGASFTGGLWGLVVGGYSNTSFGNTTTGKVIGGTLDNSSASFGAGAADGDLAGGLQQVLLDLPGNLASGAAGTGIESATGGFGTETPGPGYDDVNI